ncbi:3-deoxy-D-manno-octulosonic acid transferase [Elizabethkingia argentiflava]|uniref:3-deoxy-D-manno-octulosonic acid transferase n=2 Tax=Elizabethkingia argenteiflava TaxID=2681556 RepID=A0A845PYW0_9FLAO|nr:3-deoxy-D-manno-octulosonic acid transferase [Elizabethkingia argenteiflava]
MVFLMKILSHFNEKMRKGVEGRKEALSRVQQNFSTKDKVIWMHAASLGEYEQGLPVLEKLKIQRPDCKILITFFSPSGYEHVVKRKHIADVICYLPFDQKGAIRDFVNSFQPVVFFTVKYDFWYRLLETLKRKKIPVYVVSALFYQRQIFFSAKGKFFVNQLKKNIDLFFHQTTDSLKKAQSIGLYNSLYTGDTRFERVKSNVQNFSKIPWIQDFVCGKPVVVVGSSWETEETLVEKLLTACTSVKVILAPHDIKRAPHIQKHFQDKALRYSQLEEYWTSVQDYPILIIDNIGMLSRLYYYADIAVVGGGFHSAGLHNILEAAGFAIPVVFGNHYRKNPEADALIRAAAAKSFADAEQAALFIQRLLEDGGLRKKMALQAKVFIEEQPKATVAILREMQLLD